MALLCVRSAMEDESSVCVRTDFPFSFFSFFFPVGLHLTVTNDFCRILYVNCPSVVLCETTWLLCEAASGPCGSSTRPPLHVWDLLQLGHPALPVVTQSVTSQLSACEGIFSLVATFWLMVSWFERRRWEETKCCCSFCLFLSEEGNKLTSSCW